MEWTRFVGSSDHEEWGGLDLWAVLTKSGVDLTKPMISYCNSGMSSCTLAFAYMLCGGEDYAVYHVR